MQDKKKEEYDETLVSVAAIAKALSNPARCAILQILSRQGTCNAMDIVAMMPLSQSTVSQHLQELKNAGLIKGVPDGTRIQYSLRIKSLGRAEKSLKKFLKKIQDGDNKS